MPNSTNNFRRISNIVLVLAAFVVLLDFAIPGKMMTAEVIEIKKSRQNYYNAAQNYHYSYRVITADYEFPVNEEFAKSREYTAGVVEFSVSPLFKQVDSYNWVEWSAGPYTYSLRLISALVFPLVVFALVFASYRFKKQWNFVFLVLRILTIANIALVLS
jgi:hypothetical protein